MAKSQNDKSTKSAKSEMYDLFTYFRSSCSYRVRIALNYKDLPYKSIPITFSKKDGSLYREQLMGLEGFFGPSALLYKNDLPTATSSITEVKLPDNYSQQCEAVQELNYMHLKTQNLPKEDQQILSRCPLLKKSAPQYFSQYLH